MTETIESVRFAGDIGYFMCGNDLFKLDLPMCEKLVYIALCRYAGSNNRAWPAYKTLADDVSCSKRRAIQAVKKLCGCGLVKKEQRGNRTNVYIIYPAASFKPCAEPPPEPQYVDDRGAHSSPQGAHSSPPPPGRVQELHSEGEDAALSGCKSCTLRVQPLHPKNNKINNKEKYSSSSGGEEEREKNRQREKIKTEKPKTPAAADLEQVRKAFRSKKVAVKDSLIADLLKKHAADDVCGAIRSTNFDLSCNPINVIKWMLRENSYCMPLLPEAYSELHSHDPFSENPLQEDDRDSIRLMIHEAKNNLLKRTAMTLQPIERF